MDDALGGGAARAHLDAFDELPRSGLDPLAGMVTMFHEHRHASVEPFTGGVDVERLVAGGDIAGAEL
ncbi:hypothetical protein WME94_33465 [Sorangium sp. So ce429]